MSKASKSSSRRPIWKSTTFLVVAFLALTILPAYIAFALTPQDAQVVTSVQGWSGCAHTVRHGENLFRIGVRYGVTYQYLAQLNGIYNPNYVYAGQVISVPCGPVPYPPPYPPSGHSTYKPVYPPYQCPWCQPFEIPANCGPTVSYLVQPGDNLFRIATNNGSTIQWIRTQNNLWGKILRPGVTLQVPCAGYVKYGANVFTPTPGVPNIVTETPLPTSVPNNAIRMQAATFNPNSTTVKAGTTVTWVNAEPPSGPTYDVTSGQPGSPNGLFSSGQIMPGGQYQFTFITAGSYPYFSSTNPGTMTGTIIVQP